jgi:hypothetical protein
MSGEWAAALCAVVLLTVLCVATYRKYESRPNE